MRFVPLAAALAAACALVGCKSVSNMDAGGLMDAGGSAYKALSLTDSEVVNMSNESCAAMDKQGQLAPANSPYAQRLNRVIRAMPDTVNGKKADYKVYMTKEVNAWAMANGCIRVYSGLMDLMNDDELRGVIGHEIGHVALGHSKDAMQAAAGASVVRGVAGAAGGVVGQLSQSQAGELAEKFINAQFSQSQESAADDYSFDTLTQRKLERKGLVSAFQKLAKLNGSSGSSMLSSHPPSTERAARMQKRIDAGK